MKYTLSQLRAMFEPRVGNPRIPALVSQTLVRMHRGIPVFREAPKAARSKYVPHQGKAEIARRAA